MKTLNEIKEMMAADDTAKPWDEKLYVRDIAFAGKTIHVVGL